MVIYLDVLAVINFYITYFALKASARLLHAGYRTGRLILASVLGGLSSLSALFALDFLPSLGLRLALTAVITLAAFGFGKISAFALRCLVTAVIAALVCGITIMLRELTGSSFFAAAGGYPYLDISVLHLVISTTAVYIAVCAFRKICDKPAPDEMIKLEIKQNGKTAVLLAYPDSGNNLRDFLTGLPVIVCRKDKIRPLMPAASDNPKGIRIIPFSSVGGSGVVTAFRAESVAVIDRNGRKTAVEALIGTEENALKNESFDAVINPKIII